jgi:ELWxxDGT repeat protein
LFFFTGSGTHQLWRSDGTPEGTEMVVDLLRQFSIRDPTYMTDVNGTLYFIDNAARNLWKSDGTSQGTVMVGPLAGFSRDDAPTYIYETDTHIFVTSGSVISAISRNSGETTGIGLRGNASSALERAGVAGNRLIYPGVDLERGTELWSTDGTVEGTGLLKDIAIGRREDSDPVRFVQLNDKVLFNTQDRLHRVNMLWSTDGTADGTVPIGELVIQGGYTVSGKMYSAIVDDLLYFTAANPPGGEYDFGLWRTDGTAAGTVQINTLANGEMINSDGSFYFAGGGRFHGQEIYRLPLPSSPLPGDSNGDGVFNSSDIVQVFQRGQYEDGVPSNSTFADGDWNGDGEFDSADFVFVFQQGNYVAAVTPRDIDVAFAALHDDDETLRPLGFRPKSMDGLSKIA